jgi:phage gp36-like protein
MAYLTPAEINTHLYDEVVTEISRDDLTKLQTAINAAVAEAKGYLKAFDADAIFSAVGDDRNPILLLYVKDISVWHFIVISNPAVEWQARKDRYDMAIKWLEKVQSGKTNPDLPLPPDPVDNAGNVQSAENFVKWGGNKKRNSHF